MPKSKKGAYGIEVATGVIMSLFVLVLLIVAVVVGLVALKNSNILVAGSTEKNLTDALVNNLTQAGATFGTNFATFMAIIVVVIIMGFLGLMIYVVKRFAGSKGEKGL
jgi:hypothetical protein